MLRGRQPKELLRIPSPSGDWECQVVDVIESKSRCFGESGDAFQTDRDRILGRGFDDRTTRVFQGEAGGQAG